MTKPFCLNKQNLYEILEWKSKTIGSVKGKVIILLKYSSESPQQ